MVGAGPIARAQAPQPGQEIEVLPPLRAGPVTSPSVSTSPLAPSTAPLPANVLTLSLDTVLRLAQDRNGQVQIARLRVEEACARQSLADQHWLPEISVGPSFYRHEGGIQDFNGNLVRSSYGSVFGGVEIRGKLDLREQHVRRIEAERNLVQRRGDLTKLSSEELLAAASVYVDTLAARTGEAVARETEDRLADILVQARKLAAIDPGVRIEAVRAESEMEAHKVLVRRLREQTESARMKMLHSLGLPVTTDVALLDELTMFRLIDENQSAEVLVDRAPAERPRRRGVDAASRPARSTADRGRLREEVDPDDGARGRRSARSEPAPAATLPATTASMPRSTSAGR